MDARKLFMLISDCINFLQMGRYEYFQNRYTEAIFRMIALIGFSSMKLS